MGESKRRKAIDDMYGMAKLPESARPFILAMQEMVELQVRANSNENNSQSDYQLFFDGTLNNAPGVYGVNIPMGLFDFGEYAFTASIYALTGFLGAKRFGMVTYLSDTKKKRASLELRDVTMMLACIDGAWFYNTIRGGEKGTTSAPGIGNWNQASIKDLAMSDQSNIFMTNMVETLKKSQALRNSVKASMTLEFLKDHYRAKVFASKKIQTRGDISVN